MSKGYVYLGEDPTDYATSKSRDGVFRQRPCSFSALDEDFHEPRVTPKRRKKKPDPASVFLAEHNRHALAQAAQEHTDGLPITLRLLKVEEQRTSQVLKELAGGTTHDDVHFRDDLPLPTTLLEIEDPSKLS